MESNSENPFESPFNAGMSTVKSHNIAGRRSLYIALTAFALLFVTFLIYILLMFVLSGISPMVIVLTTMTAFGLISLIGVVAGITAAFYPVNNQTLRFTGSLVSALILHALLALIAAFFVFTFCIALIN